MSDVYMCQIQNKSALVHRKASNGAYRQDPARMLYTELASDQKAFVMTTQTEFADWIMHINHASMSFGNRNAVKFQLFKGGTTSISEINNSRVIFVTYEDAYEFLSMVEHIPFHIIIIDHSSLLTTSSGNQLSTDAVLGMYFENKRTLVKDLVIEYV
ncbi:hypothetical protein LPJ57_005001 [Coemansia sp. RSA 486]|nr:hypothetical protein LPJ57_005001 [Coemansia sp. RSA 486]KAJ2603418.1 hypothetical protein GGF39_000142 [Coemansia sp. RSA 1721]